MPRRPSKLIKLAMTTGLLCAVVAATAAQKPSSPLEMKADNLQVQSEARTADFLGHVVAKLGKWTFTCHKMSVAWNKKGALTSLLATGQVTIKRDDVTATCGRARMARGQNQLILELNPTVHQGQNRLTGKRITIDLNSKAVNVEQASGTFVLDGQGALR